MTDNQSTEPKAATDPQDRLYAFVSPADARTMAALIRHRIEDDMMLAISNGRTTRGQLIRERFNRLVEEFCG